MSALERVPDTEVTYQLNSRGRFDQHACRVAKEKGAHILQNPRAGSVSETEQTIDGNPNHSLPGGHEQHGQVRKLEIG